MVHVMQHKHMCIYQEQFRFKVSFNLIITVLNQLECVHLVFENLTISWFVFPVLIYTSLNPCVTIFTDSTKFNMTYCSINTNSDTFVSNNTEVVTVV